MISCHLGFRVPRQGRVPDERRFLRGSTSASANASTIREIRLASDLGHVDSALLNGSRLREISREIRHLEEEDMEGAPLSVNCIKYENDLN